MSGFNINMAQLLYDAFGPQYKIPPRNKEDYQGDGNGDLGLPIYESVILVDLQSSNTDTLDLGDVLVNVELERVIVRTAVQGRTGTVKEFITNGDYILNIRGMLSHGNTFTAPLEAMNQFNKWFLQPKAFGVKSQVLNNMGIYNIVVEKARIIKLEGYMNIRPFEILAYSDDDYQLMLDKDRV